MSCEIIMGGSMKARSLLALVVGMSLTMGVANAQEEQKDEKFWLTEAIPESEEELYRYAAAAVNHINRNRHHGHRTTDNHRAIELCTTLLEQYPDSKYAEEVTCWRLERMYYQAASGRLDLDELEAECRRVLDESPTSRMADHAKMRLAQLPLHRYARTPNPDGSRLNEMQFDIFPQFLEENPDSEFAEFITQELVKTGFRIRHYDKVRHWYDELKRNFPENAVLKEFAGRMKGLDAVGQPFKMKFTAVDGRKADTAKMKGKVIAVVFWASWNRNCAAINQPLDVLYKRYHSQGFEVIGVSLDKDKDKLLFHLGRRKSTMSWPNYFDGKGYDNKYAAQYGVTSLPTIFLVDKNGILTSINTTTTLMATAVPELLGEKYQPDKSKPVITKDHQEPVPDEADEKKDIEVVPVEVTD